MFGNNNNSKTKESGRSTPSTSGGAGRSFNSRVQGTVIEGDVHSKSDFRVDGTIKGSLKCEAKVVIGPTGGVEGEITCKNAVVEGRFEGGLTVSELLTIKETANVNGNIRYGKLVVQPGAVLIGDVRMTGQNVSTNTKLDKGASNSKTADTKESTGDNGKATFQKESARR